LGALGVLALPLTSVRAQEGQSATTELQSATKELRRLALRVEDLEYKLVHITSGPSDVTITGANLRIVNGLGATATTNGLGNLIVGYNEDRTPQICFPVSPCINDRTGSHNVVVGSQQNFSSSGGLVAGVFNEISAIFASVSGGGTNTANGFGASISGGNGNTVLASFASVSGGQNNSADGVASSVSGGNGNLASGGFGSVSGGVGNNVAVIGIGASVSGGTNNTASGERASVSGGSQNTASGENASVSGGLNRTAPMDNNWAAGALSSPN